MAADFIKIQRDQTAATEAAGLLQWIRDLRSVYDRVVKYQALMQHNFVSGGSIDWTQLQTLFGIPSNGTDTGASANGAVVFTFVDGIAQAMQGTAQNNSAKTITEQVG